MLQFGRAALEPVPSWAAASAAPADDALPALDAAVTGDGDDRPNPHCGFSARPMPWVVHRNRAVGRRPDPHGIVRPDPHRGSSAGRSTRLAEAQRATLWRRTLRRMARGLAAVGRHVLLGLSMQSYSMFFDVRVMTLTRDKLRREDLRRAELRRAERGEQGWPPQEPEDLGQPLTPRGHPERVIPSVPLTPNERELWADLLDAR